MHGCGPTRLANVLSLFIFYYIFLLFLFKTFRKHLRRIDKPLIASYNLKILELGSTILSKDKDKKNIGQTFLMKWNS